MKKALPYILIFVISSAAAISLVAVLFLTQPQMFHGPAIAVDSVQTARVDSVKASKETIAEETPAEKDSNAVVTSGVPVDSLILLHNALEQERTTSANLAEQLRTAMDSTLSITAAADSVQAEQRKAMAKVLEAMDPESAARILNDFPDGDVKQIILTIKKRQAAKILAALEPDRAARIMR